MARRTASVSLSQEGMLEYQGEGELNWKSFWTIPVRRLSAGRADLTHNRHQWDAESVNQRLYGSFLTIPHSEAGLAQFYLFRLYERDRGDWQTADRKLVTAGVRVKRPTGGWLTRL